MASCASFIRIEYFHDLDLHMQQFPALYNYCALVNNGLILDMIRGVILSKSWACQRRVKQHQYWTTLLEVWLCESVAELVPSARFLSEEMTVRMMRINWNT